MKVERRFTTFAVSPYDMFEYELRDVIIKNGDKVVFAQEGVEVPKQWSQQATDILASKYFRRKGMPESGHEWSVKQVVHRLARTWADYAAKLGYLQGSDDSEAYYDEMVYMLLNQMGAPNTPQWFNTGIGHVYGIQHPADGQYFYVDEKTQEVVTAKSLYERQQVSACFIQTVEDSLFGHNSIYDLITKEARMFSLGSGTGTNFSKLRSAGEPLSHGGVSSGVMSFLRILDRSAESVKSGGKTRRAAKMVILNDDHPEIFEFVNWKSKEEDKAHALIAQGYDSHFEGEAYRTVSGQNSNNSVRISSKFLKAVEENSDWDLINRLDGSVNRTVKARELYAAIVDAAHRCADPGLQFNDIINDWHTCPEDGPQEASNPCSEYLFLSETSCNLASLRLTKFLKNGMFQVKDYTHAINLWTLTLEISVACGLFPSRDIAIGTFNYRTLGLGFADLGGLLMRCGIPYDSPDGRSIAAALMSLMTAQCYKTSAIMAKEMGPYSRFQDNRSHHLNVVKNHMQCGMGIAPKNLTVQPIPLRWSDLPMSFMPIADNGWAIWKEALELGIMYGYRNAQVTVLAPTGTIGLLMDCDTLSAEPDFSLKKFKKLSGGGTMSFVNQSVNDGLRMLGWSSLERHDALAYIDQHGHLEGYLKDFGCEPITDEELKVFDCAVNAPGAKRYIHYMGHLEMMAALQPFISGGISKTVNVPNDTTPETIGKIYRKAYNMGIKCVALYRDGCKSSQPLNTTKEVVLPQNEGRAFPPDITEFVAPMVPWGSCTNCGTTSDQLVPAGVCKICPNCGTSTGGCS